MSAPQSSNAWLPGVLLLALAAISYLVHESAYQTSRPSERGTRSLALTSSTEVEARLWQDPLHAIDEHFKAEEAGGNKARNAQHHGADELKHKLDDYLAQRASAHASGSHDAAAELGAKAPADLTVLAVMVPDAPYAEPTERRRRIRYAVLSGLSRQRLVPQDQEHIFFFRHDKPHDHGRAGSGAAHAEPAYIAYEFLERMASRHGQDNTNGGGAALVLWIPTEASQSCPLSLLHRVLGNVAPDVAHARVRYAVMGPPESGTLLEMVRETLHPERCAAHSGRANSHAHGGLPLEIYSPWASAASPELAYSLQSDLAGVAPRDDEPAKTRLAEAARHCLLHHNLQRDAPRLAPPECDVEEILRQRNSFVRMIADDSLLTNALLDELALRGVDPGCAAHGLPDTDGCFGGSANRHRIAIVSEWDAPYQRALRLTLARTIRERCERRFAHDARCDAADPARGLDWLMRFSYLRGIDGRIADGSDPQASAAAKAHAADPAHPLGELETIERAEGNAQFDYVRRLAARIEDRDRELQRHGQSGIGAIGVLGTDPYDKLVILQALHARFPDKLFFTSNLDARLTHPQEAAWARNLIVVSDFDLALAPGLQRDIPPLRDAYQTAALFATHIVFREIPFSQKEAAIHAMRCQARHALGLTPCKDAADTPPVRPWLVPLVFEIGRTEAIRLPRASDLGAPGTPGCDGKADLACLDVHPAPDPTYGAIPEGLRIVSAAAAGVALAFIGLLLAYSAKPRTPHSSEEARARTRRHLKIVALVATLAALFTLFWNESMGWLTEHGLGEPAHPLEGVSLWPAEAIRLVIVALAVAFLVRSHRRLQTNRENITLDFALPRDDTGRDDDPARSLVARMKALFLTDVRDCLRESFTASPDVDPRNVESLWRFYLRDGRPCARWCRVVCLTLLFTALAWCAFVIWPDFVRFRGQFSFAADRWLFCACVVTFNFLLFYVVDALVICTRCVRRLVAGLDWPYASKAKFQAQYGADTPLDEWMSVQIVARRTEAVGRLVYMPFILLFLIIVARNSVFERWTFAPSVVALLTASAGLIVLAAFRLRETTETVRRNALESLTDRLIKTQGAGGQGAQQIGLLIAEVRELRKGAFAPYTDQTFIRALLLPLAGYATSALIEYLSLVRP